ncbi:MAG: hypothetical protein D6714_02800 [Bacteroidetes bacterium]|nr:MAG: hypothetical protein D6714_02800 [Bacteroidota bacterium]
MALYYLYMAFENGGGVYAFYLVGCVLVLSVIYIFSPQIDWWWYRRRPPQLPAQIRAMLQKNRFYQSLTAEGKKRFRDRMALYKHANDFQAKGPDSVPLDIQYAVAAAAVTVTWGEDDFLMAPYEHIYIYAHPFPSPQFPKHWHTSEHYPEDGVVLFSAGHLFKGTLEPEKYFHSGLYEFGRIYRALHSDKNYPTLSTDLWPAIEQISGFKQKGIEAWIGLPEVDLFGVMVVLFFVFPEKMKRILPEQYDQLRQIFTRPAVSEA